MRMAIVRQLGYGGYKTNTCCSHPTKSYFCLQFTVPNIMYVLKTKITDKDVTEFINHLDDENRKVDCFRLIDIFSDITKEAPKMWGTSIIGFGKYHYKYASGHEGEWAILGFSPRKKETSLYVYTQGSNSDAHLQNLGKYKMGKSCIYIKKLGDIDENNLRQIAQCTTDFISKTYRRV